MKSGMSPSLAKTRTGDQAPGDSGPKQVIGVVDAMALTVGIVIGAGIFRTPSLVASNAAGAWMVYLTWALGGVISLIGALVYAELATTFPHAGGDYHFLKRAFGYRLSFLQAWARMTVIQTGSIAFPSFVFGDYAGQILSLGEYSSAIYAALAVVALTFLNIAGVRQGTGTQNLMTGLQMAGIVLIIAAGLSVAQPPAEAAVNAASPAASSLGLMMVFVLLTYGGWNEAAYVSAELRDVRRNMLRVLFLSILIITTVYLLMNWAYVHALGLAGTAGSGQVAADVLRRAFGDRGAQIISVLVGISALTTANASAFTGARTSYALGNDFGLFAFLGRWSARTGTPVNALLVQGAIALALVFFGALTRGGFETIVEYTAPVFWFFFLFTGVSLFVLRLKEPLATRPFRVPLYPVTPVLFCLTCAYLLYSSLAYTGIGALAGVAVLAAGAVLLLFVRPLTSDIKKQHGEN